MENDIKKYCDIVRNSSNENEKAIKLLYESKLYKKVVGTLREELELYIRTLYLSQQNRINREQLLSDFFQNIQWKNSQNKRLTDREMVDFANEIGFGWEYISYKFACAFVHLSILHDWANKDAINIIRYEEKKTIVDYINQYHNANLDTNCTLEDILIYSLKIFEKIKANMEYYLEELDK